MPASSASVWVATSVPFMNILVVAFKGVRKQWKTITVRRLLPHALLHLFATELSNGLKPNSDLKGIIGQVLMPSLTTPGTPQF